MHALLRISLATLLLVSAVAFGARADDPPVTLFKVITAKDDVVVGVSKETLEAMGRGVPLDLFAAELQKRGQMSVWQYASTKNAQGQLVMSPLRRVNIIFSGTSRIEPYSSPLKIMPPN